MSTPDFRHRRVATPDDLAFPWLGLDDLCFTYDEGVYGEVTDAAKHSRGQAIASYCSEVGCAFTDVRCVVRYVLLHTRQDVWEGPGKDRWADDHVNQYLVDHGVRLSLDEAWATVPEIVPPGWQPDEYMPCWSACRPDHPRAQRAWMCEVKGDDRIPDTPERVAA